MRIVWLIGLVLALLVAPADAHRQPETETTVERGQGVTGAVLKITHRFHAHDAMRVLAIMPDTLHSRLDDPKNQARLAAYARDRFVLSGERTSEIIGVEIEGNYVFVYQEHPEVASVVASRLLADVEPGWTNRVYVRAEDGSVLRTLVFDEDNPEAR